MASKLVCSECGSDNVERRAWVNLKTGAIEYIGGVLPTKYDSLCMDCQDYNDLVEIEAYIKSQ